MPRWGVVFLLLLSTTAAAHHSTAPYDLVHGTIIGGVVAKFEWTNPHVEIWLDVAGEQNETEHWSVELESPRILGRLGWTKETVKPGDRISITGGRAKDGSFRLRAASVQFADGRKLAVLPPPEKF
ncbi:MAG TPA: DUF6152 family protein [Bryobacteraceae bacterium]|jgi:hypothetical protein|nr:DUF6152 family protein [Bryobacteraceae bacterium]